MSINLMSAVWEADLPAGEKVLLLCLADWADDAGRGVFGGQMRMARRCSCSERAVRDNLRRLEARGLLAEDSPPGGAHRTRTYRISAELLHSMRAYTPPADDAGVVAAVPPPADPAERQSVPVPPAVAAGNPSENHHQGVSTASPTTHRRAATASSNGEEQQELGGMPPPRVPPRQAGMRDPLWDLMVEEFGKPPHDDARGRRNRALRMIRQALHGEAVPLTSWPDVLRARIAVAREQWGARGIYVTDIAVANQWQLLGELVAAGDSDGHVTPQQMFDEALARGLQL